MEFFVVSGWCIVVAVWTPVVVCPSHCRQGNINETQSVFAFLNLCDNLCDWISCCDGCELAGVEMCACDNLCNDDDEDNESHSTSDSDSEGENSDDSSVDEDNSFFDNLSPAVAQACFESEYNNYVLRKQKRKDELSRLYGVLKDTISSESKNKIKAHQSYHKAKSSMNGFLLWKIMYATHQVSNLYMTEAQQRTEVYRKKNADWGRR